MNRYLNKNGVVPKKSKNSSTPKGNSQPAAHVKLSTATVNTEKERPVATKIKNRVVTSRSDSHRQNSAMMDKDATVRSQTESGKWKYTKQDEEDEEDSFDSEDDVPDEEIADLLDANSSDDAESLSESDLDNDEDEDEDDFSDEHKVEKSINVDYYDTSDEEFLNNTVGNISLEWYQNHPHIGYDIDGNKILKPATPQLLDRLLNRLDKNNRTLYDDERGTQMELTDAQIATVQNMVAGKFPEGDYDPYTPTIEWFSSDKLQTPLSAAPEPKSRFIPSKSEHKLVMRLVRAIRAGRIKVDQESQLKKPALPPWGENFYALWNNDDNAAWSETNASGTRRIQAPKMDLPDTNESYNPPEEYLPTAEEQALWEKAHPEDRTRPYLVRKYASLRQVPAYANFIKERFERCLDLYLCPRMIKMRMNVDPESLIPTLPSAQSLLPFPMKMSIEYKKAIKDRGLPIRAISVDATGQYLATADDHTLSIYEITSARCLVSIALKANRVSALAFNPSKSYSSVIAIAYDRHVDLIHVDLLSQDHEAIQAWIHTGKEAEKGETALVWQYTTVKSHQKREFSSVSLSHSHPVTALAWHRRGDYLSSVAPESGHGAVLIHQVSKGVSYAPFKKLQGIAQKVAFHPSQPMLFVATQRYVRAYHLQENQSLPKLHTGVQHVSCLDVHPTGDHVLVGSHDRRVCWFDTEVSTRPYKTLKYHTMSVRQVTFHKQYPLFASASDDGKVHVFHGKVFSDLTQNPLIVPVKILRESTGDNAVTDCQFHPSQPWLFASHQQGQVYLYT